MRLNNLWNMFCDRKYVYFLFLVNWTVPILIRLPTRFETGVDFAPGNGSGIGYICHAIEDGKRVVFTNMQWGFSVAYSITILSIIVVSYLSSWWGVKKENERNLKIIKGSMGISGYNNHVHSIKRDLRMTASLICLCMIIFRLPLIIFGRAEVEKHIFTFLSALYSLQFCSHFIIFAIVQEKYRKAYLDVLNVILPCSLRCRKNITNSDVNCATNLQSRPRTMSRWK